MDALILGIFGWLVIRFLIDCENNANEEEFDEQRDTT